ncbi:MAG: hypothetical protein HN995_11585 [Candidatus Marinimicrobia bacterium]|nr:hypothetical protein [Candidatus Neomarinimicrobiota bacterium]MBT3575128.1 hypothetical protein [Candidatus Neomarinimicrobiota bacterium]MBT3680284.1 hypothetical protein [Candidatus Neomarinimicrobiota bacterium]MBT3949563.1 hypothetical protein [Candidatus Neomarinimicrobiota bacterium]MBT4252717.1 hypothetical protein [Candidatus Neomarinimicrobiota bacterium]
MNKLFLLVSLIILVACGDSGSTLKEVERPQDVVSKRIQVFSDSVYNRIAGEWMAYYEVFPSEEAYANWMYAARYAGHADYKRLLMDGIKTYPANPTLLYLAGMRKHKMPSSDSDLALTVRAAELDPNYMDPWFNLVTEFMSRDEMEKMDNALNRLLKGGGISEEVMDYNYNLLINLEENAILITNGDNDTYPGWILQRILNHRPDVKIVNRSLLNTNWYVFHVIRQGVPRFITNADLEELKKTTRGPWDDVLINRIIEAGSDEDIPVYFSHTLYLTEGISERMKNGRKLGLATLVTPTDKSYRKQMLRVADLWTNDFRTSGMEAWTLRYGTKASAGLRLMGNYAGGILALVRELDSTHPEFSVELFEWYRAHCLELLQDQSRDAIGSTWAEISNHKTIQDWCRQERYLQD